VQVGLHASPGYLEIRVAKDRTLGYLRVLASDRADRGDLEGIGPTLGLVDELHAHVNDAVYAAIQGGLHKRAGRMLTISTAGSDEESVLGRLRRHALELAHLARDGSLTVARSDTFVMLEWAVPAGHDVEDLTVVKAANPASFVTVKALAEIQASPSMTPSRWARYHCNVWAAADDAFIDPAIWRGLADGGPPPAGVKIVLGFDGSYSRDCTALIGATVEAQSHLFVLGIWQPGDGRKVPRRQVCAAADDAFEAYDVVELAPDPPGWQLEIDEWRTRYGDEVVVEFATGGARMYPAIDRFRGAVTDAKLSHDGDAMLARHVAHCRVSERGGGVRLAKPHDAQKIDAAVAAVVAYERAWWHHNNAPPKRVPLVAFR